jgi:ATP-dependent DNA helicase RecG
MPFPPRASLLGLYIDTTVTQQEARECPDLTTSLTQLEEWLLLSAENEHIEFKLAERSYDFEKLLDYCVALANEGGGKLILGVTNQPPRRVVGSAAFGNVQEVRERIHALLHRRIEIEEIPHSNGRVLIFHVPSRPRGEALHRDGRYLMRVGENLVAMTFDQIQRIAAEADPDYSAQAMPEVNISDLAPEMIEEFRSRWIRKAGNRALDACTREQLLTDAGLLVDGVVTMGALILLGTPVTVARHLPQAEVIFEYRSSEGSTSYQQRVSLRSGFFGFNEELWELINRRNDRQSYQDGLFRYEIPTLDETVVREAVLNAVSHRDYRAGESVFVRQYPRRLEIISPGGFPPGITPENVLDRQSPRNRTIAEALELCGLVERSGQGMNRMFEESIKQGKPRPDFTGTDAYQVSVNLRGELQHPMFVRYLEKLGRERVESFNTQDFLVLDYAQRGEPVPEPLRSRVDRLVDVGAIERVGRRVMLSRDLYAAMGQRGVYTRRKGLARDAQKELLLQHIRENPKDGCPLSELLEVLSNVSERKVKGLLQELKNESKIAPSGQRRWARWFPVEARTSMDFLPSKGPKIPGL